MHYTHSQLHLSTRAPQKPYCRNFPPANRFFAPAFFTRLLADALPRRFHRVMIYKVNPSRCKILSQMLYLWTALPIHVVTPRIKQYFTNTRNSLPITRTVTQSVQGPYTNQANPSHPYFHVEVDDTADPRLFPTPKFLSHIPTDKKTYRSSTYNKCRCTLHNNFYNIPAFLPTNYTN